MAKRAILLMVWFFLSIGIQGCMEHYESIETGSAYGFTIGNTKKEAFNAAKVAFEGKDVYMYLANIHDGQPVGQRGEESVIGRYVFNEKNYAIISKGDHWEFFLEAGNSNMIRLTFNDEKLIKIYRHKSWLNY